MKFYFHISNGRTSAEDEDGMELPSFGAALAEAERIAKELRDDPDTEEMEDGVVQVVSASGLFFVTVPIISRKVLEVPN